jgi:hypothetical protein
MAKKASSAQSDGENISAYFRSIFEAHPDWLKARSNDAVLAQWQHDHPGEKEVPNRVKQNLSNIKSVLRKKLRKKPGRPKGQHTSEAPASAPAESPKKKVHGLEALEEQIDDCLSLAKHLDREGLDNVINLLRKARNAVVWMLGE